jgi:hypothetical protein
VAGSPTYLHDRVLGFCHDDAADTSYRDSLQRAARFLREHHPDRVLLINLSPTVLLQPALYNLFKNTCVEFPCAWHAPAGAAVLPLETSIHVTACIHKWCAPALSPTLTLTLTLTLSLSLVTAGCSWTRTMWCACTRAHRRRRPQPACCASSQRATSPTVASTSRSRRQRATSPACPQCRNATRTRACRCSAWRCRRRCDQRRRPPQRRWRTGDTSQRHCTLLGNQRRIRPYRSCCTAWR